MGLIKNTVFTGIGIFIGWLIFRKKLDKEDEGIPFKPQPNITIQRIVPGIQQDIYEVILINSSPIPTDAGFYYIVRVKDGQVLYQEKPIIFNELQSITRIVNLRQNERYSIISGHGRCIDDEEILDT